MAQHKWHKEIISYLNGEKVYGRMDTHKSIIAEFEVTELSQFDMYDHSFYIKPQPKESQYLYVWIPHDEEGKTVITHRKPRGVLSDSVYKYVGKIKLETENE